MAANNNRFDKKSLEEDMKIGVSSDDAIDNDLPASDASSPISSKQGYRSDVEPESYLDLLRPNRKNRKIEGFSLDFLFLEEDSAHRKGHNHSAAADKGYDGEQCAFLVQCDKIEHIGRRNEHRYQQQSPIPAQRSPLAPARKRT